MQVRVQLIAISLSWSPRRGQRGTRHAPSLSPAPLTARPQSVRRGNARHRPAVRRCGRHFPGRTDLVSRIGHAEIGGPTGETGRARRRTRYEPGGTGAQAGHISRFVGRERAVAGAAVQAQRELVFGGALPVPPGSFPRRGPRCGTAGALVATRNCIPANSPSRQSQARCPSRTRNSAKAASAPGKRAEAPGGRRREQEQRRAGTRAIWPACCRRWSRCGPAGVAGRPRRRTPRCAAAPWRHPGRPGLVRGRAHHNEPLHGDTGAGRAGRTAPPPLRRRSQRPHPTGWHGRHSQWGRQRSPPPPPAPARAASQASASVSRPLRRRRRPPATAGAGPCRSGTPPATREAIRAGVGGTALGHRPGGRPREPVQGLRSHRPGARCCGAPSGGAPRPAPAPAK